MGWNQPTAVVEKLGGTGTSDMDGEGRWREKLCKEKTCPARGRGGGLCRSHNKGQYTWVRTNCARWQFICEVDDGTYTVLHICDGDGGEGPYPSATGPPW